MKRFLFSYLLVISLSACIYSQSFDGTYYGVYDDGEIGGDAIIKIECGKILICIENDQYSGQTIKVEKEYELVDFGPFMKLRLAVRDWLFLIWGKGFFISDTKGYYTFFSKAPQTRTTVIDNTWIISSTSYLREGETDYNAARLMCVTGLPWTSGNGYGIGDRLIIDIGGVDLPMLIVNGFVSLNNPKLYFENARLKTMRISSKKTRKSKVVTIGDNASFQKIEIRDIIEIGSPDEQLFLDVIDVYQGNKYNNLCIKTIIPDFSSK